MVELIWDNKQEMLSETNSETFYQTDKKLIPCIEESKNFDNTDNLYIEGDNLDALKLLKKDYENKIKMIYIDPPYNTEKKFMYNDTFRNKKKKECRHSGWLNMIYPRLRVAKDLLTNDGVIFISIGDEEVENLRKICDEVFGEDNFKNQIIVRRGAKSVQAQFDTWDKLGQGFEYILFYTKRSDYRFKKQMKTLDDEKCGSWNNHWRGTDRPTMRYDIFGITPESGQWRWGKDRSYKAIDNYNRMLKETGCTNDNISQEIIDSWYLKQNDEFDLLRLSANSKPEHYIPPTNETLLNSSWVDLLVGSSSEIGQLFETKVFDTAKLTSIICRMLNFIDKDSIILDFFSGSATTAHAVMKLNAEDGGNRKFIMVQLPEETDEKSEAYKAGYKNICEIGKERIRRASKKIHEDRPGTVFDDGFKVYKIK
jgi:adenine-specific DNA-methyltransferase